MMGVQMFSITRPVKRRISVRGIIFKDGELFLVRHIDDKGNPRNRLSTPGGRLEKGEALTEGVHRELVEETGVVPTVGRLLFILQFVNDFGVEVVDFFFHIENPEDYTNVDLTKTTHGVREIAECGFFVPKDSTIRPSFLEELDIAAHLRENKPVVIINDL